MTIVTVDDLHVAEDPRARLAIAAQRARVRADDSEPARLIIRCPHRQTDGVRALGADDIAHMLMRHARIADIGITEDGTICAAGDLVDRRGEIAIWTGRAIGGWHPSDIVERGLGGSETAAVRLAEQLAAMGYLVTLYGDFQQAGVCGDVMLRRHGEYDESQPLDALICFRDARRLDHRPNARFVALWLEDLAPAEGLTPARAANIDRVVAVSHWHRGQVLAEYPWLDPDLVAAGRNGVHLDWYREGFAPEREKRVVYSSSPDRGGDIVLECWPEIRKRVPDAELILTYPRWFELCASMFRAAAMHRDRLRELVEQPGVKRLDEGMGQKQLANLMRSSLVWVNPGYYTPGADKFEETSCISCMEAQAAGCVVVASNWGALTENVLHGTLVDGDPSEKDGAWRRAFVDAVVRGLTDEVTQQAAQTVGPEMMAGMDWRAAAEQLAAMFEKPGSGRPLVLAGVAGS